MKKFTFFLMLAFALFSCEKIEQQKQAVSDSTNDPKTGTILHLNRISGQSGYALTQINGAVAASGVLVRTIENPLIDGPFSKHPGFTCLPAGTYDYMKSPADYRFPYPYIQIKKTGVIVGYIHRGTYVWDCEQKSVIVGTSLIDLNGDKLKDCLNSDIALTQLLTGITTTGTIIIQ